MAQKIKVMKFTSQKESSAYLDGKRIAETSRDWMAGTYRWFVLDSEGWRHEGSEDMPEFAFDEVLRVLRQLYPGHEIHVSPWT